MSQLHTDMITSSFQNDINSKESVLDRIPTRITKIGENLDIRRALPTNIRRMVGAWCFLDHAGPVQFSPGEGLHVGPHPHIGLQTFTWLIEGEIIHRDSLGYEQIIRPGQVNLMTAGSGIVHSEDSTKDGQALHTVQLWIALPDSQRHCDPAFIHYPDLPVQTIGGFQATILVGTALGMTAPSQVYTPLVGIDFNATIAAQADVDLNPAFEYAALTLRGTAKIANETLVPGTLLYLGQGRQRLNLQCEEAAQILLLGGEPFNEDIILWWNFVARTQLEIETATHHWNNQTYFLPLPNNPAKRLQAPSLQDFHLKPSR